MNHCSEGLRRRALLTLPLALGSCQSIEAARAVSPGYLGRGFHLGENVSLGRADFEVLRKVGASVVRYGLRLRQVSSSPWFEIENEGRRSLGRVADLCRQNDIRLVVVLRPHPENDGKIWHSAEHRRALTSIWLELTEEYKGNSVIAAFDLVNEPHPPGLTFGLKEAQWRTLAIGLIREIRRLDSERQVVYEPSPGARPMAFAYVEPLPFDGVHYSAHMYEPFEFTHQKTGDDRFVKAESYPGMISGVGVWNRSRLIRELEIVEKFRRSHSVPIYIGEFGVVRWASSGRRTYISDLIRIFNDYGWSWTYHAFREWHGWDAEMDSNPRSRVRSFGSDVFEAVVSGL